MDTPAIGVEIRGRAATWSCTGPDWSGACPRAEPDEIVPCAGSQLHLTSAPDDLWVFTASQTSRTCPLRWLVMRPRTAGGQDVFEVSRAF